MPISPPDGYTMAMNPTQLGPYEIKSRLGRGGMGAVYEAIDTTSGHTVAVKVLASHLADDPGLRSRFDAEIETLKNLRHPGIVRLLAFGEQDDQPFFAMELVRGKSLEQILRSGRRFTWQETVAVALEVTRALKVAHDHGIVHRDLKPANLLVADPMSGVTEPQARATTEGGAERVTVKLADFGIAKLFGGVAHTALGHVVGTAEYMAPEQATGRPIDHRADLYSLGLVMFAMLTGSPPFRGAQLTEVIDQQRRAIPPRVASLVPGVPAEFDELIARLLSKDPAQRPASALALGRLLSAIETLHVAAPGTAADAAPSPSHAAPAPRPAPTIPPASKAAPGPTAHERSNKPTRPVDGFAATGPISLPGKPPVRREVVDDIDLLAPTQALPSPIAPPTRPRTAASASLGAPSRLPTDVASATTQVDRSSRNQFVTVAEVERAAAEKERREQVWQLVWQGLTAVVIVAALGGVAWFLMKPPTADQAYERIMAVANDEHGDLRDVRSGMEHFLDKHAADPRAGQIRELKRTLDLDTLERRARRRSRSDQSGSSKELAPLEREYRAAMTSEENGPSACVKSLEAMLAVHGSDTTNGGDDTESSLWLALARRKVEQLRPQALTEQRDDAKRISELLADAASLAARATIANDESARKKFTADRRVILENVVEVYAERPHAAEAVAFAKRELAGQPSATTPGTGPAASITTPDSKTPASKTPASKIPGTN
jgi:eukaryotic-like serine/threonine-protein kinase